MSDKKTTLTLTSENGATVLELTWIDGEQHFTMEANPYCEGLGEVDAMHLLGMAGDIYRAIVGQEPAYYFSGDENDK